MSAPPYIPAMANVHSPAFQRDVRGRAERPSRSGNDFWSASVVAQYPWLAGIAPESSRLALATGAGANVVIPPS